MSRFHYIGSPVELPLGARGPVPSKRKYSEVIASPEYKERQAALREQGMIPLEDIFDLSHIRDADCLVFDTEEDAAGIFIQDIHYLYAPVRGHFNSPYVYRISSEGGDFAVSTKWKEANPESYKASLKCCRELFKLMREFGGPSSEFEIYTCWADEEEYPRNRKLERTIDLSAFELEDGFELLEKQYILVKIS